jgi:hypothetical protein
MIRYVPFARWSPASHVALSLSDNGPLIHARGARKDGKTGVVVQSRDEWASIGNYTVAEYRVVPDVSYGLQNRVLPAVGQRAFGYDLIGVRGVQRAVDVLTWPWTLKLRGVGNRIICSQLVMLLDPTGVSIPEWRKLDYGTVDPADLLDVAKTGPSFVRIA